MTQESDPYEVGRVIALRALDRRAMTSGQVLDLLRRRGVPPDAADRVVERMVEVQLIDDRAYAQSWVQSRLRSRGSSRRVLAGELRRKLVPDDVIDEVLADVSADDETDSAVSVLAARLRRRGVPRDAADRKRLVAQVMRRGHGWGAAEQIVDRAVAEVEQAEH